MEHDYHSHEYDPKMLATLGAGAIAYMRQITAEEIIAKFKPAPQVQNGETYWALFAADGAPLMLAGDQKELVNSAFQNNLVPVKPN